MKVQDEKIPDYAKDYIKECVSQEKRSFFDCGLQEADKYAFGLFSSWDLYGFSNKWEMEYTYKAYITARRIRNYCRRNKITTRKNTVHCLDGRREHQLWDIVRNSDLDNEADGMRWSVRKVDGLKNIYIWF